MTDATSESDRPEGPLEPHVSTGPALLSDPVVFFEQSPVIAFAIDAEAKVQNVNAYGADVLGYRRDEMIGQPLTRFILPEDYPLIEAQLALSRQNPGIIYNAQVRKVDRNGRLLWLKESARTVQAPGYAPVTLVTCEDVSKQIELEAAQRSSSRLLELVLQRMGEGLAVVDRNYHYLIYNEKARQLLGVPAAGPNPEEWPRYFGLYLPDKVTPCPVDQLPLVRALRGEEDTVEFFVRNQSVPEGRWGLCTLGPLRDETGEIEGGIAVFRDVSEQKKLIEELSKRTRQLSEAQQIAHVGSWEWEIPTDRITWSDELYRIYGLRPGEWEPRFEAVLARIHSEDREFVRQTIEQANRDHRPFSLEYRILTPDGAIRFLQGRGEVIVSPEGIPLRMMGTAQDITERKQLEMQLRDQFERLKELDRLKSTFVNSVTHELRTPLTSIMGYAEFLEDEIGGTLTPTQHTYVNELQRGAKRLENLLNDLLDFARLEAGTFKLTLQETDLRSKIQESIDSLLPQAIERNLLLEAHLPEHSLKVPMDEKRIGQVLLNLIGNAIKFTPPGGRIDVSARNEGDYVRCEVADTGIGIAEADLPKLFQRFVQLEPGVRTGSGSGLGLSISKSIVESHGGNIGVRREAEGGSVFWFTLPLHPERSQTH